MTFSVSVAQDRLKGSVWQRKLSPLLPRVGGEALTAYAPIIPCHTPIIPCHTHYPVSHSIIPCRTLIILCHTPLSRVTLPLSCVTLHHPGSHSHHPMSHSIISCHTPIIPCHTSIIPCHSHHPTHPHHPMSPIPCRWVLLKNVHLAPQWLVSLEKKLHSLTPHAAFRLFLTMEINPKVRVM